MTAPVTAAVGLGTRALLDARGLGSRLKACLIGRVISRGLQHPTSTMVDVVHGPRS